MAVVLILQIDYFYALILHKVLYLEIHHDFLLGVVRKFPIKIKKTMKKNYLLPQHRNILYKKGSR